MKVCIILAVALFSLASAVPHGGGDRYPNKHKEMESSYEGGKHESSKSYEESTKAAYPTKTHYAESSLPMAYEESSPKAYPTKDHYEDKKDNYESSKSYEESSNYPAQKDNYEMKKDHYEGKKDNYERDNYKSYEGKKDNNHEMKPYDTPYKYYETTPIRSKYQDKYPAMENKYLSSQYEANNYENRNYEGHIYEKRQFDEPVFERRQTYKKQEAAYGNKQYPRSNGMYDQRYPAAPAVNGYRMSQQHYEESSPKHYEVGRAEYNKNKKEYDNKYESSKSYEESSNYPAIKDSYEMKKDNSYDSYGDKKEYSPMQNNYKHESADHIKKNYRL